MELTFECPECERVNRLEPVEVATRVDCPCGWSRELRLTAFKDGALDACPFCATEDLYIQKDFPHALGLAIVITGIGIATVFWYFYMPVWSMAVLLLTAALDLALFYLVADVTICYRCLSQYRGTGSNPGGRYQPFDLAIGERYRQERIRIEELRQREKPQSTNSAH